MKKIIYYFVISILILFSSKSFSQINTFPYFENFESGGGGWIATRVDSLTSWEYGTPNYGSTTGAYSGNYCWDINLASSYNANAEAELISPSFDLTSLDIPRISFYINHFTEKNWDGTEIKYSVDGGLTWIILGYFGDPDGINWYNNFSINSLIGPGWDDNSFGWKKVTYKAYQCTGYSNIKFKFVFHSDFSYAIDGVSIDDFKIDNVPLHEVSLASIITPDTSGTINYQLPSYSLEFRNIGSQNIDTLNYDIILNGNIVFSGVFTGLVPPGNYSSIPVSNTIITQQNNSLCARLTLMGETDTSDNFLCKNIIGIRAFEAKLNSINVVSNYVAPNISCQPITMRIVNLGDSALTGFTCGYKVNGVIANTATFASYLFPNDTLLLTLPGFIVTQDSSIVCAFVSAAGDYDTTNNVVCTTLNWLQTFNLPFQDNFDGNDYGWYTETKGLPNSNWELGTPSYGITNSTFSAPNAWDINLDSSYKDDANCVLYSPLFNFTSVIEPKLRFWQNRYTESRWDGMRIEYLDSTGIGWQLLGYYGDPYGINWYGDSLLRSSNLPGWSGTSNGWEFSEYDLDHLALSGYVQFRFVFTSDPSLTLDGITIDNFQISIKEDYDALISEVIEPNNSSLQSISAQVKVRFKNDGLLPITSLGIKYRLNGGPIVSYTWSGFLGINDSTIVQLPNLVPIGGNNSLKVYIEWLADQNHFNDTLLYSFVPDYAYDAFISEVIEPNNSALLNTSTQVKVSLKNNGQLPITSLGIKYRLNGGLVVSYTWSGFLASNDSTIAQLPNLIPIGGTNSIKVFIDWPSDQNRNNDTIVHQFDAAYEYDAALDQIISPGPFIVQGINTQIKVALRNNGALPLTSLTIKYVLNSNATVNYNWTGNLLNDSIAIVTLGNFIPNPGVNTLKVYSEWNLDTFYNNDTLKTVMIPIIPQNVPYTTAFETGNNSWISNLNFGITNWELGTPSTLVPPAVHSGSSCWDVNLAGNYFSNSNINLTTPFFLVSQQGILNLDFWLKYESESGSDLMWVEYSTEGVTWNRLGSYFDPNGTNWYNTIAGSNIGWSGNSGGWQNSQLNVYNPFGNNLMQFRFVFKSDGANNFEGFSVDDFTISVITSLAENNLSNNKIIVYPNPAQTTLQVNIDQKYIGQNYNVLNQLGQTVLTGTFKTELTALDISKMDAGIYVLKIGDAAIKFVKE